MLLEPACLRPPGYDLLTRAQGMPVAAPTKTPEPAVGQPPRAPIPPCLGSASFARKRAQWRHHIQAITSLSHPSVPRSLELTRRSGLRGRRDDGGREKCTRVVAVYEHGCAGMGVEVARRARRRFAGGGDRIGLREPLRCTVAVALRDWRASVPVAREKRAAIFEFAEAGYRAVWRYVRWNGQHSHFARKARTTWHAY